MSNHSRLFVELTKDNKIITSTHEEIQLNPYKVREKLNHSELNLQALYREIIDLLRETNDAQYDIVSTYNKEKNAWVRDATNAIPLDQRMLPDAPVITANNMLLRCLSRLRPIDYAISKKYENNNHIATKFSAEIREKFSQLAFEVLVIAQATDHNPIKQAKINTKEEEFNTFLVHKLYDANLTAGCKNKADAKDLLFYYRNLSSVLYPARTMVTKTYDKQAKITQLETQYPVTSKTEKQKRALQKLETIIPYPDKEQKNSHTSRKPAFQEADQLFKDLIASDDTVLPAQARKTHLVSAKNAFIVKIELIKGKLESSEPHFESFDKEENKGHVLWLARMGSPVFVGSGEDESNLQEQTRENLEQIRRAAAEKMGIKDFNLLKIHVTSLNTDSPSENQNIIIDHVYQATRKNKGNHDDVSYVPTNFDGTNRALDIAPGLDFEEEKQPHGTAPTQKATRVDSAATVILAASNDSRTISLTHCASGQDRTGTAIERAIQKWMYKIYKQLHAETNNIELTRAIGGNAAEITSHYVPGSPGMKSDSIANNFLGRTTFSSEVQARFYLKSAETNKKNKVGNVDFLNRPSALAVTEYERWYEQLQNTLKEKRQCSIKLSKAADNILKQVRSLSKGKPGELDAQSLYDLTCVLSTAYASLIDLPNKEKTKYHARELGALSQGISGKPSRAWQALGFGLLVFACTALLTVGILAAIPSGGTSMLAAIAGTAGLITASGAVTSFGIGVGIGTVATVIGAATVGSTAIHQGREKGLAKSVSKLKHALCEIKNELPNESIDQGQVSSPII
ncbi:putative esterase with patatin domain [Legionella busanensis]|uniref:Putative esterase with patatin domain n=1 Tax=Legionella busanensis TaxID=190655 RepID=A0A378JLH2_9GAMM|nr:hypothetical protein [Legionella busanensis]STX51591.1 putative esterase with patatin domain [Legionella busanensis]